MTKKLILIIAGLSIVAPASSQTESAEEYLHPSLNHDDFGYVPEPQSATDYTQGTVRLGDIPGQDLVRPLGGNGTPLGALKASRPSNRTKDEASPGPLIPSTSKQTAALGRDSVTGLPLDLSSQNPRPQ